MFRIVSVILLIALLPDVCLGACTAPAGGEGATVYNKDEHTLQYCDGTNWVAMIQDVLTGSAGCNLPATCPNVGDVCDDGNPTNDPDPKFAGFMVYNHDTCEPLFVAQTTQSTGSNWRASGTSPDDIPTDSFEDGKINDAQIADSSTFPAFKICKDLDYGGHTDWYLPARMELEILWLNRAAIGGFTTGSYWSSSEKTTDSTIAWRKDFNSNGYTSVYNKINARDVRCVRRD